ncbi:cyanophycinase [Roseateles aquatilis]|uniref:Cyanophycinase n=1 Tax=Roseateles aquatilis TaxID=431061 RepID=A0A246J4R4_9BURK|nr:cyanophycinase [Roseateles aquatilis]OWQ87587.1 cyanophycinase [Roseateles aquatilis]
MRSPTHFPLPAPLALIGGNEDRLDRREVLRALVAELHVGGASPPDIAVLSTASGEPELLWSYYEPAFRELGARPHWLDVRDREAAADPATLDRVRGARLLFMTGGDQERLVEVVGGTPLHALIRERHAGGELLIAGTSAGASALGTHMPVGDLDDQFAGPDDAYPLHPGLDLLPRLVIDQHFAQRKRHARLLHLVTLDPRRIGVGIDEDTMLLLRPGEGLRVVGAGAVTVIDGTRMSDRRGPASAAGDVVALENVGFYLLPAGTSLDLDNARSPVAPHLRRVLETLVSPPTLGNA